MPDWGLVLVLRFYPMWCNHPSFIKRTMSIPIVGQKMETVASGPAPVQPCDSGPVTAALTSVLN